MHPLMWWVVLAGCWPDIRGKLYEPFDTAEAAQAPNVVHVDQGDGTTMTTIDATDASIWVYVDLDDGMAELDGEAAGWDLGISRQRIKLNGGVSGTEGVEVAAVAAASLAEVTAAPDPTAFGSDQPDDDDDNGEPEYAFDVWFDYDSSSHVLTPKDLVFVVRSTGGALTAIEIVDYYDEAGTSGIFLLHWKPL